MNVALRLRGQTFTGTFGVTPAGDVWINPYSRVDLQVNYKLRPGFDLFFDARNLNDAYWSQTTGVQNSLSTSINPGRAFFFGFKYKPGARE